MLPCSLLQHVLPSHQNTQLDTQPQTFSPELLSNSPNTFILGDFNAITPLGTFTSPDSAGNSLFNGISSSQLDSTLNDPDMYTQLHHSL